MWEYGYIVGPTNMDMAGCMGVAFFESLLQNEELIDFIKNEKFDAALVDLKGNHVWMTLCHSLKIPIVTFWR